MNLKQVMFGDHSLFPINTLALGLNFDLFSIGKFLVAGGGELTDTILLNLNYKQIL